MPINGPTKSPWNDLDEAQRARVRAFVEDAWVVDFIDENDEPVRTPEEADALTDENLRALLDEVTSPLEIHAMAAGFNWDCGAGSLLKVLEHPLTDRSTILLAYWRSAPRYYARLPDPRNASRDGYETVLALHRMLESRQNEVARISFDPACDNTAGGHDWTAEYRDRSMGRTIYSVPTAFERPAVAGEAGVEGATLAPASTPRVVIPFPKKTL